MNFIISETARTTIRNLIIGAIVVIAVGVVSSMFHSVFTPVSFALGVLLLMVHNIISAAWIDREATAIADMDDQAAAAGHIRSQSFLRMMMTVAFLGIAVVVPFVDVLGAAAGLLVYRFALHSLYFSRPKDEVSG